MTGYMLNSSTKKCITGTIINCSVYSPDGTCFQCAFPYLMNKLGACSAMCSNLATIVRDTVGNRCVAIASTPGQNTNANLGSTATTCVANELYCQRCRFSLPTTSSAATFQYGCMSLTLPNARNAQSDGCNEVSNDYFTQNCLYYGMDLMCDQCIEGYSLTSDKQGCIKSTGYVSNCRQFLPGFGDRCLICNELYYMKNNKSCVKLA